MENENKLRAKGSKENTLQSLTKVRTKKITVFNAKF